MTNAKAIWTKKNAARVREQKRASYQRHKERNLAERRARYAASLGKSAAEIRVHANKDQMADRLSELYEITESIQPATVRQVFYQATVKGIIPKTENAYKLVGKALVKLRREGKMPWHWIVDNLRTVQNFHTHDSPRDALQEAVEDYAMDIWKNKEDRVQIWLEKDALAGVLWSVVSKWRVPFVVARGFPSWSVLKKAADQIEAFEGTTYLYQFGDYDPSGVDAARFVKDAIHELAPHSQFEFRRVALTPAQIRHFRLPSRPTTTEDSRAAKFDDESTELDAFTPLQLQTLVADAIQRHISERDLKRLLKQEEAERASLQDLVDSV